MRPSNTHNLVVRLCLQAKYLLKKGVGGAFIWSLEMDDFRGSCGAGKYPLLSAIADVLRVRSSRRSSFFDDFDEFSTDVREVGGGSREVGGPRAERDGDRATSPRYRSSRRHERPTHSDVDDHHVQSTRRRSHADSSRRRHQQSLDLDEVTSGRRRTSWRDDLAEDIRRHDDVDGGGRQSDRGRESFVDDVSPRRRVWDEPVPSDRRSTSDGRRRTSSDIGWNDESRAASTFSEKDLFARNNRRTDAVDRYGSSRGRGVEDRHDPPVHGQFGVITNTSSDNMLLFYWRRGIIPGRIAGVEIPAQQRTQTSLKVSTPLPVKWRIE